LLVTAIFLAVPHQKDKHKEKIYYNIFNLMKVLCMSSVLTRTLSHCTDSCTVYLAGRPTVSGSAKFLQDLQMAVLKECETGVAVEIKALRTKCQNYQTKIWI
jgi:hypothetical protein